MGVGSELEAKCRKCGEVWHVVIAEADGRIAKVECRECGARHGYRPVGGAQARVIRRHRTASTPASRRARDRAPVVEADLSRPPRPFRTSDTYAVGDRVVHSRFGEGVVQAVTGATKIQVLFESGPRTLVHARDHR
ncbi:MAG: hypothetical protein QNK04_05035 [Myxococcota bacterium]|nr:hypothetical protein [Myxococcota bacterium]